MRLSAIYLICFAGILAFLSGCSRKENTEQKYVDIPGTPVRLVPPEEFTLAPDIGGFKHARLTASIMVQESPKDLKTVSDGFSAAALTKQGGELLTSFSVVIDSTEAMLYKTFRASQGLNFVQWILVMPLQDHALTIISTYLKENDKELSARVKNALLTTRINEKNKGDKTQLAFSIDQGPLTVAKYLQGPSVMFTEHGDWNDQSIFRLSFFAGPSMDNTIADRSEDFALGQLKTICADCTVDKDGLRKVNIDSLEGYEIVAYRNDSVTATRRLKYQLVLFDASLYYLLVGTASENYESNLTIFKGIAKSFKRNARPR